MSNSFFTLQEPYETLEAPEDFFKLTETSGGLIKDFLYKPEELKGSANKFPRTVKKIKFTNVSFTRTHIESIDFYDCVFEKCLFIKCLINNCEFHGCKFIDTNTHKIDFVRVYIDPNSFKKCLDPERHENIGTHLYQRLMQNSNAESQREFGRRASFNFNTWKRRQLYYEFKNNWRKRRHRQSVYSLLKVAFRWLWGIWGAGAFIHRFIISSVLTLFVLSTINFLFREKFGLDGIINCVDSLYFTVITMTTIGYGDITPAKDLGKVIVAVEGLFGFFLFALAASFVFRRIAP